MHIEQFELRVLFLTWAERLGKHFDKLDFGRVVLEGKKKCEKFTTTTTSPKDNGQISGEL